MILTGIFIIKEHLSEARQVLLWEQWSPLFSREWRMYFVTQGKPCAFKIILQSRENREFRWKKKSNFSHKYLERVYLDFYLFFVIVLCTIDVCNWAFYKEKLFYKSWRRCSGNCRNKMLWFFCFVLFFSFLNNQNCFPNILLGGKLDVFLLLLLYKH